VNDISGCKGSPTEPSTRRNTNEVKEAKKRKRCSSSKKAQVYLQKKKKKTRKPSRNA
jgi:hypothetical protein